MVYYPLQLLQRVGVTRGAARDGQAARRRLHRPARRRPRPVALARTSRSSSSISPTRCRSSRAGSPRSSGWRATSPRGEKLVVCLGDNIFENAQAEAIASLGATGALVFVNEVDDPVSFGVVAYDEDGRCRGHRREGGRRRHPLPRAALARRGRRALLLPARRLRDHRLARAVGPRRARDHRRQPRLRRAGRAASVQRVDGWWHDGGKHWGDLADVGRLIEETGVNKVGAGDRQRFPLTPPRGRAWLVQRARARERAPEAVPPGEPRLVAAGRDPRAALPRARPGRPLRLPAGNGARRRARPRDAASAFSEDIGDDNPVAIYVPGPPRPRLRGAHRLPLLLPRHRGVRRRRPRRARHPLGRPARRRPLEHEIAASLGAGQRPRRPDHRRRRAARPRAGRAVPGGGRRSRARRWDVRFPPPAGSSARRARPARGGVDRTSTAPRTTRRGRRR